ncbi:MAG: SDR family oxidoreductase [Pseudomonadota bacterium]|nr:SDR family oxidoreductase [Pseudomonadota bacterium]
MMQDLPVLKLFNISGKFAKESLLVNAIRPGFVPSDMLVSAVNHNYDDMTKRVPLKRMGAVSDNAGVVLYLLSPASHYVTGHVLVGTVV